MCIVLAFYDGHFAFWLSYWVEINIQSQITISHCDGAMCLAHCLHSTHSVYDSSQFYGKKFNQRWEHENTSHAIYLYCFYLIRT